MATKSPSNVPNNHFFLRQGSVLISVLIVAYLFLFLATPFEPYSFGGETFRRVQLFMFLLLPEHFLVAWNGGGEPFAPLDKLAPCGAALVCLVAASGFGGLLLRLCRVRKISAGERILFASVGGLGLFSLCFALLGMLGLCHSTAIARTLTVIGLLGVPSVLPVRFFLLPWRKQRFGSTSSRKRVCSWPILLLAIPAFLTLLGMSAIPSTEYDVLSYHLEGAKEFFLAGRIRFAEHNVYMNMPFGAEMFSLWGMALCADWKLGGQVGQLLIASTTLLTAGGLYTFAGRFLHERTGAIAALLYLQTPWIQSVSGSGLIDGVLAAYLFFSFYALLCWRNRTRAGETLLIGFFAGCAAACKYPGLVFVAFPIIAFFALFEIKSRRKNKEIFSSGARPRTYRFLILFFGIIAGGGIWYCKNWLLVHNPFFPLLASLFGFEHWDPLVNARWAAAHSAHDFSLAALGRGILQVGLRSPFLEPLSIPLALAGILGLFTMRRKGLVKLLAVYFLFGLACWWFFTHRLDRFWLPFLPLLILLAAIGATLPKRRHGPDFKVRPAFLCGLFIFSTAYCFLVNASPQPGKNVAFFAPREGRYRMTPWTIYYNENRPQGTLLVYGEAQVYDFEATSLLYATCWNDPPLVKRPKVSGEIKRGLRGFGDGLSVSDATTERIRGRLRSANVSDILVHWGEIERFRSPGNYGFNDFPSPGYFELLVRHKLLEPVDLGEEAARQGVKAYRVRSADSLDGTVD